ncbi:BMP family ABC transporter substrate-binding protein [Entomospira entomophila]|uniref:BMP family ABC transporter substrate-binding protein n=1 Tax=Entomospira entomophila TaxID=2719988 RepID=A0A968KRU8_9SPIO|nr:BMP family ABC transporter substrate-binding protein [Entomospira entomophilus]NIZ41128.1 BMP family ABC transporter substrate-binding protein [Entomospira entomophilus]WDI35335.1 BMP family ABC transporter substrate-binding protein [Entomospira entomophilus]
MKKFIKGVALFATVAMVSCVNKGSQDTSQLDIMLVTEGAGIEDKSFNASAWRGITGYFGDTPESTKHRGTRYEYINAGAQDQIFNSINIAVDENPRLVMGTGFTFEEPMQRVATVQPEQKFLLIDAPHGDFENIRAIVFKEHEGAFLVGVAAALQSIEDGVENPKFGFVGGLQGDVISRFELGYIQGVRSILPDAIIEDYYAESWSAADRGKTKAKAWFNNGFYAIFSAAGATGSGVIAEAKEQRMAGKNVWAIGVDSDQYEDGIYVTATGESAVLTSMIKLVEKAVVDTLTDLDNHTFTGGTFRYGLLEEGVSFSERNPALSLSVIAKTHAIAERIKRGEIVVLETYSEVSEAGLLPTGLTLS